MIVDVWSQPAVRAPSKHHSNHQNIIEALSEHYQGTIRALSRHNIKAPLEIMIPRKRDCVREKNSINAWIWQRPQESLPSVIQDFTEFATVITCEAAVHVLPPHFEDSIFDRRRSS